MSKESFKYNNHIILNKETRWASESEIKRNANHLNLLDTQYPTAGIPLMSDAKEAWVDGLDHHTLIFGATGSKKTRLFCLPTVNMMIKAGESFVVTDPKGEIFARTYHYAKENGYKTAVLNFRDLSRGDCWNPLNMPYKFYKSGDINKAISFINDFIEIIKSPLTVGTLDPFWYETAHSLILANMIFLMECGKENEINITSLSNMSGLDNMEWLKRLTQFMDSKSIAGINYKNIFTAAEKTLQRICISVYSMLRIFNIQPNLSRMLSNSSFDVENIGNEKTAIYIIVPDEKVTYHFLAAAFIKQLYDALIDVSQKQPAGRLPVRVNFVLDEFCNMPKIPSMSSMISAARSRNMRFFLVAQNIHQLVAKYGQDADTIKGNCENWVFLASKELKLLEEISSLCGNYREASGNVRSLISVSELQHLDKGKGEALILYGRNYPFITHLPDIDDYKMFQSEKATVELPEIHHDYAIFDLKEYARAIRRDRKPFPFSSVESSADHDLHSDISTAGSSAGDDLSFMYKPDADNDRFD